MKTGEKQLRAALLHTFFELYDAKNLAKECVRRTNIELHEAKRTSFSLRCGKDQEIGDSELTEVIVKSLRELMNDRMDEVLDIMSDEYDIAYDADAIDDDLVRALFDYTRDGRLIHVDIDV